MSECETFAKVVLLGESGVGKTSILNRYIDNVFVENRPQTVGATFQKKIVNYDGKQISLSIWDTAGQEVYRNLTPMYYRDAQMALIIFSIVDKISFDAVKDWVNQVRSSSPEVIIVICGNKNDIPDRVIKYEEGLSLAEDLNLQYIETSAENGNGIDNAFEMLVQNYYNDVSSQSKNTLKRAGTVDNVDITTNNQDKNKKCCN